MGFLFCRSRWREKLKGASEWHPWRETPCFHKVGEIFRDAELIQTRIDPSYTDYIDLYIGSGSHFYKGTQTPEEAEAFMRDVLEALPGIAKVVAPWTFEFELGTNENYWKFLAVSTLLRYVEEFWCWPEEYRRLRSEGIPRDVALLVCNLGRKSPLIWCGHGFLGGLDKLNSFRDFKLAPLIADGKNPPNAHGTSLWNMLMREPWFLQFGSYWPNSFPITREVYEVFCDPNATYTQKADAIDRAAGKPVVTRQNEVLYRQIAA